MRSWNGVFALATILPFVFAVPANAQPYGGGGYGPGYGMMGGGYGPGMMGGYGPGWMMGPGMMGGYGPGMMGGYGPGMMGGYGYYGRQGNLNLSTNDVKNYLERMLAIRGNSRLKVGEIKEKDADTIVADVVTKDKDALVQRYLVDRRSGFYREEN